LAASITIAVLSIAEITARQQFLSLISARIEIIKSEIVELSKDTRRVAPSESNPPKGSETTSSEDIELIRKFEMIDLALAVDRKRHELAHLTEIREDLNSLLAVGAENFEQTLRSLRRSTNISSISPIPSPTVSKSDTDLAFNPSV